MGQTLPTDGPSALDIVRAYVRKRPLLWVTLPSVSTLFSTYVVPTVERFVVTPQYLERRLEQFKDELRLEVPKSRVTVPNSESYPDPRLKRENTTPNVVATV